VLVAELGARFLSLSLYVDALMLNFNFLLLYGRGEYDAQYNKLKCLSGVMLAQLHSLHFFGELYMLNFLNINHLLVQG